MRGKWVSDDVLIAELKRIEENLNRAKSENQALQAMLDLANDAIIMKGLDGTVHSWNKAAESIYGYPPEEAIGQNISFISPRERRDELVHLLARIANRESVSHYETTRVSKDGRTIDISLSLSPILDDHGNVVGALSIGRDISKRKAAERKLKDYAHGLREEVRRQADEFIQSEKMVALGIMVAGIAHEINNPLAFMKTNSEFLKEDLWKLRDALKDDPAALKGLDALVRMADTILDGIKRVNEITSALKRFARPDSGERAVMDINQGLRDTLIILFNQMKHRIIVHEEFGEVPRFKANPGQINQVFLNLILNSSQAMDKGDIWIRTWAGEGKAFIEIRDNGEGMTEEVQKRIFDPFFTTKKTGTGLGLSISFRIIKGHGGSLQLKSEVGKGTTAKIELPMEGIQ